MADKNVCKNGKQPFIDTNVRVSTYIYIYTHTVYMAQRLVVPSPWDGDGPYMYKDTHKIMQVCVYLYVT